MTAGKAGFLHRVLNISNNADILGAGTYGLVASNSKQTVKLFYDLNGCKELSEEANLQETARKLLLGIVKVPKIHEILSYTTPFRNKMYLCGIVMDKVPLVEGMPSATHILLGYDQNDIDTEWSRNHVDPPSEENPTRGFHASPSMMEAIWEDEGRTDIRIEDIAYIMGKALRVLIDGGVIPYDLEWIYGGDGNVYLIDFGLCDFGHVEPYEYLKKRGSTGLDGDYYIPHIGDRGYSEFMQGFSLL